MANHHIAGVVSLLYLLIPTLSCPNYSDQLGSYQSRNMAKSDTDLVPRFTAREKGKQTATAHTSMLGDEPIFGEGQTYRDSVTPTPYATEVIPPQSIEVLPLNNLWILGSSCYYQ